ncbi:AAA family ATPase [Candidatus Nomurabacteria bacterium]|nr:AAA family ATPase [Candidatus Nomurabacteria bacterium]
MFTQFFGLKFNPFTKEVPVHQLFNGVEHKELESRLKYLQSTRGIFLLTAEAGTGKTTALRNFCDGLNPGLYRPCYYSLTTVTVMDFYRGLILKFGELPTHKKVTMFEQLQRLILSSYNEQRITPVIIIDEAQSLSNKVLDDLRILFNFAMDSQNPFILILAGQSSLRNRLQMGINTALRQRINVKYHMQGLARDEIREYIHSRLKNAGAMDCDIFSESALDSIHTITAGIPRAVNNLIIGCLMFACTKQSKLIDDEIVFQANRDIDL